MLEVKNITVAFGAKTILDSVSLVLGQGERLALLGASGSGKTTLLRILAGILRPSSGVVICRGIPREFADDERWNAWIWPQVTLVFQDIRLFPALTGFDNCIVGIGPEASNYAQSLADQLAVKHCLDRRPHQMSQGEQQRIAIIRALLRHPTYVLMDEPTSALDTSIQLRVARVINDLPTEVSVLVATHDLAFAQSIATGYFALHNGKLSKAKTLHEAVDLVATVKASK